MNRESGNGGEFRSRLLRCGLALAVALALGACHHHPTGETPGSYVASSTVNGLPDVPLVDQDGHDLSLASLKGKPVLIDFFYTTCRGPCSILTNKMGLVARLLGPELGPKITMVSVTLDPEHDHPAQLKEYMRKNSANRRGWIFLTGSPAQIEQVLAAYGLRRQREADGSVTHMTTVFLLGPDGRQVRIYDGLKLAPTTVGTDVLRMVDEG